MRPRYLAGSGPACAGEPVPITRSHFVNASAAAIALFAGRGRARAAQAVNESGYVRIGGIDQWIAIQGDDPSDPAIVYLHGGPAEAQSPFLAEFRPWEQAFTVVNWDQRGSGKTFERNGAATPDMTLDRLASDAVEVAQYACRRLGKRHVILVAQSFGCIIGLHAIQWQTQVFSAYVGTGQPVHWTLSLEAREAFARQQMLAAHDTAALQTLDAAVLLQPTDMKRLAASAKWRWAASDRAYLDIERGFMLWAGGGQEPRRSSLDCRRRLHGNQNVAGRYLVRRAYDDAFRCADLCDSRPR